MDLLMALGNVSAMTALVTAAFDRTLQTYGLIAFYVIALVVQ